MTPFPFKRNDSPCGKNCPDRTTTCRPTCKKWEIYERERLEKAASRGTYAPSASFTQGKYDCITRYTKDTKRNHKRRK